MGVEAVGLDDEAEGALTMGVFELGVVDALETEETEELSVCESLFEVPSFDAVLKFTSQAVRQRINVIVVRMDKIFFIYNSSKIKKVCATEVAHTKNASTPMLRHIFISVSNVNVNKRIFTIVKYAPLGQFMY